jgi:biopolymer transport protein TolR
MPLGSSQMSGRSMYTPLADINVTPLVDVTLVLLIIFMVTAPMLAAGVKVNLPQASRAAQPLPQQDPVTITVARDGALYVNAEPVARELLVSVVRARLRERTDSPIRLRGDRDASYGDIIGVLDLLAGEGLTRIAIMTNTQAVDAAPQRPHD